MHRAASTLVGFLVSFCFAFALACDGGKQGPYGTKGEPKKEEAGKADKASPTDKKEETKEEPAADVDPKLLDPTAATEDPPEKFKAKFETTKGDFVIEVNSKWSPEGAKRFYNLVKIGYYDDVAFFRAVKGFMVQFGIHGSGEVNRVWRNAKIKDDSVKQSNTKGFVTFAKSGAPDSRTVQVFINYGNNANLDGMGFSPFGKVVEGMDVVETLHTGYGDSPPNGRGPEQQRFQSEGNAYLKQQFSELDYIKKATIVE
jgi:peptidyl-prolyl cis-trans isomerase A (cyclophilin A)